MMFGLKEKRAQTFHLRPTEVPPSTRFQTQTKSRARLGAPLSASFWKLKIGGFRLERQLH
jgi:hypothetical protein